MIDLDRIALEAKEQENNNRRWIVTQRQPQYLQYLSKTGPNAVSEDDTAEFDLSFEEVFLHPPTDEKMREDAALYRELLFAVGNKYPNESRHETALRYIKQAEAVPCDAARAAEGEK